MKAVFAQEIGTRVSLRMYWGDKECSGWIHNAHFHLWDIPEKINYNHFGGEPEDYPEELWQLLRCEKCGLPAPADAKRQVFNERLYDTPSGKPEPGCLFWADWYPENFLWDNQVGPHLMAMLPNGWQWDIDSRASNCTMPEDRKHRCWCRHGEVPNITVNKNGLTCQAGAGSILAGGWHGFLTNGEFIQC